MAMAAVVASVTAGETVIPHLVDATEATSKAKPLTNEEARQLRGMMRAVVTQGSGRVLGDLSGPPVLAKTGTAEYGASKPLQDARLDDRGSRRSRCCCLRQRRQIWLALLLVRCCIRSWPRLAEAGCLLH